MLKNYIKIAWRNLWKHKVFAGINITGMAVAFGAVILLSITAFYELSYDTFHQNKNSIYQLYREEHIATGYDNNTTMSAPFAPTLKKEFPDLLVSRFGDFGGSVLRYQNKEFNYSVRTVDADFFKMFTFPILEGNKVAPLKNIDNIVISKTIAESIFGKADAIGKVIQIKNGSEWKDFIISSVITDAPKNSSIDFDLLIRFEHSPNYAGGKNDWDMSNHNLFMQLPNQVSQAQFEQKLKLFVHKYLKDKITKAKINGGHPDSENEYYRLRLIPLTELHFSTISLMNNSTSKFYPYLLLVISVFILFIATVNFINLSLGRAFTRAKEIGVRKVLGASKKQILVQFCTESVIICTASLLVGMLLAYWLFPQYKTIFNQPLRLSALTNSMLPAYFIVGFIVVALLAGGYPALMMTSYKIAQTVKGKISTGKSNNMRNSLMVVQFVISGVLIICTTIAWQQLNFLRTKSLGYNKSQVISIPVGSNIDPQRALDLMRVKLAADPRVQSVTGTDMNMGRGRDNSSSTSQMTFDYKGKSIKTHWRRIDYDYVRTLQLQMVSGREFSKSYGTDTASVVINQTMAQMLGSKNTAGSVFAVDNKKFLVVGVVKDFNFQSLRKEVEPLTMFIDPHWPLNYIFVRVSPDNLPASMASITSTWKQVNAKAESSPSFLDENTGRQYEKEGRLSKIFISGAMLTIIISCMGLFAIAVLVISHRTKEIGIRKVLGANITSIIALVSKDFMKLILVSAIIATPIAWYSMNSWLQDFAYRISIHWWVFVVSGVMAMLIAFATISFQSVKAALANPVKSLKSE
ncbi:ABC transporter permease [Mucilaginibacter sp. AW1-3]